MAEHCLVDLTEHQASPGRVKPEEFTVGGKFAHEEAGKKNELVEGTPESCPNDWRGTDFKATDTAGEGGDAVKDGPSGVNLASGKHHSFVAQDTKLDVTTGEHKGKKRPFGN
jgi:hypothetical protein